MRPSLLTALILHLVSPALLAAPAPPQWITTGPYGGEVLSLAGSDKGMLYAGTHQGVFVSKDWGENWELGSAGLAGAEVQGLALDAAGVALAATSRGLYRKPAGGAVWQPVGPAGFYFCVAVDPTGAIFAGTYDSGLVESLDHGATWTTSSLGNPAPAIYKLTLDNAGSIYAGTQQGVFVSRDSGASWQAHPLAQGAAVVTAVGLGPSADPNADPGDRPTVFAGTRSGEVFASVDQGSSWSRLTDIALPSAITGVTALPDGTLYAANNQGVWTLDPAHKGWRRDASGYSGGAVNGLLTLPGHLLLATAGGVEARTGDTWTLRNTGLWAHVVAAAAAGSNTVVVATRQGLFRSLDAGASWDYSGEPRAEILCLCVSPHGTLFAGGLSTGHPAGILRSTDSGTGWQVMADTSPQGNIYDLAADPDGTVYAATQAGLYRSTDNGDTWHESDEGMGSESLRSIAILPDGSLFTCSRNGIFRSTDHAAHWEAINDGLTSGHAEVLAASPDGALYASSGPRIFRSLDRGRSWQLRSFVPEGSPGPVRLVAAAAHVLFAGDLQTGVWQSLDGGAHWQRLSSNAYVTHVLSLTLTPAGRLFAGCSGAGLWQLSLSHATPTGSITGASHL